MVPCQCHGNREKEKQSQAQVHVSSKKDTNAERKTSSKLELFSLSFESNYAVALVLFFLSAFGPKKGTLCCVIKRNFKQS